MADRLPQIYTWTGLFILTGAVLGMVHIPRQQDFYVLLAFYIPAFAAYIWLYRQAAEDHLLFYLAAAVIIRLLLLPAIPNLSDDIYRFIWDGRLINAGLNPFDHLPGYYLEEGHRVPGLTADLFARLNSPEYFTIYPPVAQAVFATASWLFPHSITGATLVIRAVLIAAEAGTLIFLPRVLQGWGMPPKRALFYAFNPLVIVEISGNLHFEGVMVLMFVAGLRWLQIGRINTAALAMAGAVAAKLVPLMFFPLFIRRLYAAGRWPVVFRFFGICGAALLVFFTPLLNGVFFRNIGQSLGLYFHQFEFNAGLYYMARWIGYQVAGYNQIAWIGPRLAILSAGFILLLAALERGKDWKSLPEIAMWSLLAYLACGTTIHPWYTIMLLFLSLFTRWRFPVVWTGLIMLTYIHYLNGAFKENYWVIGIEYGGVLVGILIEIFGRPRRALQR